MRVVLDSNVIVAAYATHGLCHSLFELCMAGQTLILSQDILNEVSAALLDRIKVPPKVVREIISYLKQNAVMARPEALPPGTCRDADDLRVLGLAVGTRFDCLVSGDKDLLVIGQVQGIPILTPREFYTLLQAKP